MKLLIALVVVSAVSVSAGEDWKMFMKWAKTKAMESCWGEENMKLHTLNMKKAVSKCLQVDAPETDLPPFRYLNRFTNNLVNMANNRHQYGYEHGDQEMMKMMKMMIMAKMMDSFGGHNEDHHSQRHGCDGFHDCDDSYTRGGYTGGQNKLMRVIMKMTQPQHPENLGGEPMYRHMDMDHMDDMDMFSKMFRSMKSNNNYKSNDYSPMMKRFMVRGRLSCLV